MKNTIIIFFALCLTFSCTTNQKQDSDSNNKYDSFAKVFQEVSNTLVRDNGKFWDHNLIGPILLVDPETREIISNQNNKSEEFLRLKDIFVDTLPAEVNIANTALDWEGKRWTMVMLPLPKEQKTRNNLIIHELFHRIQPFIGFDNLLEQSNAHLDTYHGRLLLKLELEALIHAISTTGKERITHIENALRFRTERQASNDIKNAENTLELNEGLAEYTGVMLSDRSSKELNVHFKSSVDNFYNNKTFVRSFAYETIPIYGYLLYKIKDNWHREITKETNLTDYFKNSFPVNMDRAIPFMTIAKQNDYQFEKIQKEEKQREEERLKVVANYKELFLNNPTLKLMFENMRISFDPRNIVPLENIGSVYPTLSITDNWGILTVEKAALLSSDWQNVIVTEPIEISESTINGEGWKLELNENWQVVKTNTIYELKKK